MLHKTNSRYVSPRGTPFVIRISCALFLNVQEGFNYPEIMRGSRRRSPGGGVCIEKSIPRGRGGGGVCIEKSIRAGGGWGGFELSDQLLDPDVPTLASQDKLKVSPKGLPFVTST